MRTTSMRQTAIAEIATLVYLVGSGVTRRVVIAVRRRYRYTGYENAKGGATNRVEDLRTADVVLNLNDPASWAEAWDAVFDLGAELDISQPRAREWLLAGLAQLPEREAGAAEMLVRSIAAALHFPIYEVADELSAGIVPAVEQLQGEQLGLWST